MDFDDILDNLNSRGVLLDGLGQIEDGKKWSARVRKKGTTKIGYGYGKDIERAVKAALSCMRDSLSATEWKKMAAPVNPDAGMKKRKRVRIKAKR